MTGWKDAERQVAKILGGKRRIRINYSESCEDVHHARYAVEVKYGKQNPKWIRKIKEPVIVNGVLVLFRLEMPVSFEKAKEKRLVKIKFLVDGMCQANSYNHFQTKKVPFLVMKPRGYKGLIGCMYIMDFMESEFCK